MASNNAPRGLVLAKKNGDGSNSTGIRTIDLVHASPKVASALMPSDMFTGDPIMIESSGTIRPNPANVTVKCAGVFQGCSFVNASGEQKFARSITGGVTATDVKIHIASDPAQTFFIQSNIVVTAAEHPTGIAIQNAPFPASTEGCQFNNGTEYPTSDVPPGGEFVPNSGLLSFYNVSYFYIGFIGFTISFFSGLLIAVVQFGRHKWTLTAQQKDGRLHYFIFDHFFSFIS